MTNSKPIKVTEANLPKIEAVIKAVEGRATQRTVSVSDVLADIEAAEERLVALGVPKKYWEGVRIATEESFRLANSYGYRAESTLVNVVRVKGSWKFTGVFRGHCGKTGGSRVTLSDEAQAHIPKAYDL